MKATYIGNPDLPKEQREVPDTFEMFGITFEKGKASAIPSHLQAKLAGNSHFKVSDKATAEKQESSESQTETVAALAERIASVEDVAALEAELSTETRATGKAALEARIAALKAPTE